MVTSLLSVFDPSSVMMFNWMVILFYIPFMFLSYWMLMSRYLYLFKEFITLLSGLFKNIKGSGLLFVSIFVYLMITNILGLMPYVFSATSHFKFNISIGLVIWMGTVVWSLVYNLKHVLSHLTPMGCPMILVPFMVMVEMMSFMIRPLTLSLRLMANMLAGHLILSLINLGVIKMSIYFSMNLFLVGTFMFMFELSVCLIQSYVFSYLLFLYWEE